MARFVAARNCRTDFTRRFVFLLVDLEAFQIVRLGGNVVVCHDAISYGRAVLERLAHGVFGHVVRHVETNDGRYDDGSHGSDCARDNAFAFFGCEELPNVRCRVTSLMHAEGIAD